MSHGPVDRAIADWGVPGADLALGAVCGGDVVWRVGDRDARFDLASVTKPLVAWATLVAVEEGTVHLGSPAGPAGSTVRHLLAHASGMPLDGPAPIAAPGVRRIYSNRGFELLGGHLAERSDIGWSEYASAAIAGPLTMTATTFGSSAAHGAHSTVNDVLRFALEVASPTLLDPTTVQEACTEQFPGLRGVLPGIGAFDPNPWGLGVEIRATKSPHWTGTRCSSRTVGHFGAAGTFWWFDPDRDLAVVGLGRRPFGPWALEAWPTVSDAVIEMLA